MVETFILTVKHIIIILAGGLLPNGGLPPHVWKRVEAGIQLARLGDLVVCSSSYSLNLPPKIRVDGHAYSEAHQMALAFKSARPDIDVRIENFSHDTIGSAVFTRLVFLSIYKNVNSVNKFKYNLYKYI